MAGFAGQRSTAATILYGPQGGGGMRRGNSWWFKPIPAWIVLVVITVVGVLIGFSTGAKVAEWVVAPIGLWMGYAAARRLLRISDLGRSAARLVWVAALGGFVLLLLGTRLLGIGSALGPSPVLSEPLDTAYDAAWGFLIGVGVTAGVMASRLSDEGRPLR